MTTRFEAKRAEKVPAGRGWDIKFGAATIVLTLLSMCGAGFAWLVNHENRDFAAEVKVCGQLTEAAALVAAARSNETALAELAKYQVIYLGVAHSVIKDEKVIDAKIAFYWTAREAIESGRMPSQDVSAATVILAENCKSMRKPWF